MEKSSTTFRPSAPDATSTRPRRPTLRHAHYDEEEDVEDDKDVDFIVSSPCDSSSDVQDAADADTFRILVATDNHLGFMEKDPIRGNDSFAAFEEILLIAQRNQVDFVLLGGDLFHENKPSRSCMYKTMNMLRRYCMGDRPVAFDFLTAQDVVFKDSFHRVNYQDPNLNIALPLFSIHGNHDDPSGDGDLCALDLLSVAGFVNYFGRQTQIDDVHVAPVLLKKGRTKLALYGLGNIRDERLHRTFLEKKVKMYRPTKDKDHWFNLFVLHQNRVKRGPSNWIPEHFLDDFLHLIVWGHEHECLVDLQESPARGFFISQPGSSVATSLCEGEAVQKHVALVTIMPKKEFYLEKIPLKQVRPFVTGDIVLSEHVAHQASEERAINDFLADKVDELIEEAREKWMNENPTADPQYFPRPLIRLRVEYTDFETINPQRFGQQFVDKVANVKDILHFYRKKVAGAPKSKLPEPQSVLDLLDQPDRLDKVQVEDLVNEFLKVQNLSILPENGIGEAVRLFVEKEDRDAISDYVLGHLAKTQTKIQEEASGGDDYDLLEKIRIEKMRGAAELEVELADRIKTGRVVIPKHVRDAEGADQSEAADVPTASSNRKRGSASKPAGRGGRSGGGATRTGKRKQANSGDEEEENTSIAFGLNSEEPAKKRRKAAESRNVEADTNDDDDDFRIREEVAESITYLAADEVTPTQKGLTSGAPFGTARSARIPPAPRAANSKLAATSIRSRELDTDSEIDDQADKPPMRTAASEGGTKRVRVTRSKGGLVENPESGESASSSKRRAAPSSKARGNVTTSGAATMPKAAGRTRSSAAGAGTARVTRNSVVSSSGGSQLRQQTLNFASAPPTKVSARQAEFEEAENEDDEDLAMDLRGFKQQQQKRHQN
ncbi:meiotic recombination 11 [Zopfochytrium polystomum]|nr:meiotic recombination 11 [Zopfochytrium polystomum]